MSPTKILLSYEQLQPNCLAKQFVDVYKKAYGVVDKEQKGGQLLFNVNGKTGDLELRRDGQEFPMCITPCP